MTRYLAGRIMAASALVVMILSAKSQKKDWVQAKVFYELVLNGNVNNPLDWAKSELHNCPGTGNLGGIDIFTSDVYTAAEALAAGNPSWAAHPKVNIFGTQFTTDLATAARSPVDAQVINDRTYFKRSIR